MTEDVTSPAVRRIYEKRQKLQAEFTESAKMHSAQKPLQTDVSTASQAAGVMTHRLYTSSKDEYRRTFAMRRLPNRPFETRERI